MKTQTHFTTTILLLTGSLYSNAFASTIICGDSQLPHELSVKIEIDPYKHGQEQWDRLPGASPAPDPYGKVQLFDQTCEIPAQEDSLLVEIIFKIAGKLKTGESLSIQLFDRDTLRQDDTIAIGNVEITDNPTVAQIGAAKLTLSSTAK